MSFEDLTPELQEKARACKSREELAELAKAVGVELSDDELEAVAGGTCPKNCPRDGVVCMVDTQCLTKTSCPTKFSCPTQSGSPIPFECPELDFVPEDSSPIPDPQG